MPRLGAALVALTAWAGLIVQFAATFDRTGSVGESLWVLARYFTVLTNVLVALTFTALALGRKVRPSLLGGAVLAILLVGVVYLTLLRGLIELSGGALLADALLHKVVPALAGASWLLFAPKGRLGWAAPAWWSLYPLAYFAYALVRGANEGRYPYPFLDVGRIGYAQTLLNGAMIAAGFLVAGLVMVALDHALARRGSWR